MLEDAAGGHYRKLVIADGRIAGAILLGHGNDVAAVRTAITRGFDVTHQHLDTLRAGRWDVLAELSGDQPLVPRPACRTTPSTGIAASSRPCGVGGRWGILSA